MRDDFNLETDASRPVNGHDQQGLSGLDFWQLNLQRRRRERRADRVQLLLMLAAVGMGVVIGYALSLVMRGGA